MNIKLLQPYFLVNSNMLSMSLNTFWSDYYQKYISLYRILKLTSADWADFAHFQLLELIISVN